jgi:hypothetical protein
MQKRASFNGDRYRTATIDNSRKLTTPNRIDIGSRPVPNMNRGASSLSGADVEYDSNANYARRSNNGRNTGYRSEGKLEMQYDIIQLHCYVIYDLLKCISRS